MTWRALTIIPYAVENTDGSNEVLYSGRIMVGRCS